MKMKIWTSMALLSLSLTAWASSDVKVTSFKFLDYGSRFSASAELCGKLINPTGKAEMIRVMSDPEEKSPGSYYVWAGPDGKFCAVIATYTGKAEVSLQK